MPDNRYYIFKDAKGGKHTVDKAAYDSDPEGFAKAFPGARMEVIDRKTGRRGDVAVKDAGRIGDFGANLFTGRRVKKQPQQQPKTALGKAQQSVAQEKWGDKPLGEYTKPGSFGDLMKQEDAQMDAYNGETQKAIKEMAARTRAERKRMDAPVVDTGNANVNKYVVNTQGQMERQMMDSGRELADKHLGGYVSKSIEDVFKDATARGVAAENALSKASPFASMWAGEAYNEALDPDKLIAQLSKKAEKDMTGLFANPKAKEDIKLKAAAYGVAPEEYVSKILAPGLQAKIAEEFDKSELSRSMPKSTAEYIIRGVNDSMIGTILSMGMMSKKQRQYAQQGMAMTDNGENPYVKPGMGARVARGTLSFVADAPAFGAAGKAGAAVAGKAFGNGVAQAARIANTSLAGRIGRMVGTGAVSQGVTGVLYGSTNAAVQNYSTGDDTSIGNTVKLMTMGGLSEGASWATMGGIGGAVGAGIYNVSGVKRIPAKVFQIAMEGVGMHMGGNVAKMIEGHDTDWLSVEGNLEACANVVALKLTHARLPKRQMKDGKTESYLDMVKRNVANLMVSDGQRAALGGYVFTKEEKEQLFGSDKAPKREETLYGYDAHDNPITRKESLVDWALRTKKTAAKGKGEESYKDTDVEFVKTAYDEIMADNTIPWDTKAKFSALVMGTVPSARPMMDHIAIERDGGGAYVGEYSLNGELLSKNRYKTADERDSILYTVSTKKENQRLSNAYGAAQIRNEAAAQKTLEAVAEKYGFTAEQMKAAMDKDPLKRSEEEQNACVELRKTYEGEQFQEGALHPDQSQTEGKDVVEENGLGTENPNNEAVAEVLDALVKSEDALQAAMDGNDVFKQEYERLKKEGLSNPQIYMELINSGLTQEQLAPLADYINANAKTQGMFKGTQNKIAEVTQKHVEQWSYKGELNGEKLNGGQMLFVKDNKGRLLIVGAGDVAFDNEGRARDTVGDMISVLDPNTRKMDFVSVKDVQLDHVEKTEDYAKNYQTMLEELNSTAYAESEKGKEKSEESDTKPSEASLSLPKPGEQPKGEDAPVPVDEDVKPIGEGEKKNPSDKGNGSNETLTFADGTPVPMMKDSKGRETADYSRMTHEHGAEWMSSQFGENAEAAVDGQIKRAEKMLKEAEKIKVDYTGDLNDAKEAEAQKKMAVDAAKAELELYTNIKKAMTEKKVKAGMEKVGSVGDVGSVGSVGEVGNVGVVREKFESGKRVVGNKRTRTLSDGTKIKGHYELVEADSLTPSHNANDGYKKSEGFPVNEEGRTINDRDYENDKDAQRVTDMIARHYDGQAVDQVPVVTTDGIVVDGNGRTMAGQKAAKDGTDGAYLEALKENAENYGFTAEQIEQSGMKHPRLVLVSDEPMKYDTATFAKFNMNEKKSQGNTQQAVANSKKLSTDEISVIVSEIEGSGSLDAFFNNSTAINSLLKRLVDKGVIGLNEVAGLREGEDKLSAAGKDFVKNLLLGSVFSENTIRMMGADAMLKTKALNGIRAVTDNMKLGDYALMKEIDQAVQLLYEARQGGSGVDAYLRTPAMFGENAADRFDPISQAIALALEGKVEDFRELMMAYNRNAAPYADANQTEMFGERPTKEDFVNEFLKLRNWKDYETRHSSKEGNGDAGSSEGTEPQAPGGNVITSETDYNKAVEQLKEAKGEERERILDQMGEYVKEFAKSNGYDEPVVLRTKQDLADAAKTENDKTIIENMPEGAHYPGYYEDGKIHIYLEGSTGSEELRETFEHESVHADNEVDPSRVEALVYSITDMNTLTREELERVVEVLSNMKEYTERASEMNDVDALYMLADEALAHLVTYAQEHGKDAMSEITDNPTLLNIAEKSLKERENDRRRKEGLAKSGDKTLERKNLDDVSTEENGGALEGDKEGKPENDNGGSPDRDIQAGEEQREVDKAVKNIATEITKKTGIEVVTDEKEAEEVIRESEETDSDLKYHKETDEATLEELENGETVKVYRAMQVIDGKLYPPMAAAVNGKRVEANELGVWIRADENPDLAIPDIDPKTKEQKVDKKTGELKWKFKLDKGGKDATGKKATDIPAAYNPYWHTSRSPLNDQFKSAWIRPNIVVVECEVPVSELSSGYRAERAKDAVGEVDWKSGVVSGEVYKQTGRARKVILSRWCKPVRVLSDAEVAQRAKEFVGDAKVEIPENVLTPRQRIEFEKAGFKIGAPEKGVKKSDQILEALKRGLQIDNEIKEHRASAGSTISGMKQLPKELQMNESVLTNEILQYHGNEISRRLDEVPDDATVNYTSAHDGKWYFYSVDKDRNINLLDAVEATRDNYEQFKSKLKEYGIYDIARKVRDGMPEAERTGRTDRDLFMSFVGAGLRGSDRVRNGEAEGEQGTNRSGVDEQNRGTRLEGNSEKQGEVKYFRTANGEVYGFTDGEKIYLDTKKMKPETPLHEYAHLWCDMLRKVNPKEWENVKKLFDKVEGLKEEVQKLYPELEGDALYEEMITTYSGREGTKKLEDVVRKLAAEEGKSVTESAKAQGFLEKVKVALTKYWKGVADVLGIHFTTAEEVADKVLADWAKGENPLSILPKKEENTLNPIVKAAENYKKDHPLTEGEIRNSDVDDIAKDMAVDYLNGEVTDDLHRAVYESIYEKVKDAKMKNATKQADNKTETTETPKVEASASPIEGMKNAAEKFAKEKEAAAEAMGEVKKPQQKADDAAVEASNKKVNDLWNDLLKAGREDLSASFIGLNARQLEVLPKLVSAMAENAYLRIKRGMHNLEDVVKEMRKEFAPAAQVFKKEDVDAIYEQMMNIRYRDGEQRMSLKEWADYYEKTSPKHQENLVGDSKEAEDRKVSENKFIDAVKLQLAFGRKIKSIIELRKIAERHGLKDIKDTDLQELAEAAIVMKARGIASSESINEAVKFERIKKLYENQPSLNQRDSERVMKQQYSTPAPYAFLADMYVKAGIEVKSALEPSAGNGMLTIGLPKDAVHVNDIDAQRLVNLQRQGFKNITSQDGTQPFADKDVDVVVTNPPFGSATPRDYDGYTISSLEGQMAINALESMKDNGRAAIIIGGKTEYAKNGSLNPKDKALLGYLYSHYNVEDVINVDGSLYAKQGTTFPTRIILINGRRFDENAYPPVKDKARAEAVKSYDELYKRINDDILQSGRMDSPVGKGGEDANAKPNRPSVADANEEGVRAGGNGGGEQKTSVRTGGVHDKTAEPVSDNVLGTEGGTKPGENGGLPDGAAGANGAGTEPASSKEPTTGTNKQRGNEPGGNGRPNTQSNADETTDAGNGGGSRGQLERLDRPVRELSSEKVAYTPRSENPFTLKAVMPADQQESVNKNLEKLGDADQFLVDELGYNDKADLYAHLAAEQVDSVALALQQAKKGNAFIIGDMTGIGKGRQAASLIRYAKKQGQVPVYFTKTAGLLSDVYRDLVDIGSKELRPFVFGSAKEAAITDADGNIVFALPSKSEVKRVLDYIEKNGELPKEYDYVLTTYSQVSNGVYEFDENGNRKERKLAKGKKFGAAAISGQARRDAIEKLMKNGYLILDESHTAGGDSGQGNYFQHIIQKAKNVTFFSATFAKRPDNMPIYALRTAMNQGGLKASDLIDAVKRGGATLQEIMSQALTQCGQMIRRERDMTGVTIDWKAIDDPEVVAEQREQYDSIIGLFNDIINFQRTYVSAYVDRRNEELAEVQSSMGIKRGTEALGIKNQPFASKAFNTVQQVLLSLKAKSAAERAIDYLKQGMKPVIALNNTNESQTGNLALGEEMDAPDLGTSLKKGLEGTLRYTSKNAKDESESGYINLSDLGADAVEAYHALEEKIRKTSTGLSLSPIDVIKNELTKAGYKVGELTGRQTEFAYNENGTVTKVKRADTDKKKLAREFNDGQIDALILNKSAATGISLHASSKYADQRKRVMIVAQQQLDVNDEVQMRGRIDRTGQVARGAYEYVVSLIPAEQRLLMMFKAKLKSLDANTTSSQKSKFNEMEVADITNKYGDKVVKEYMAEHLDLYARMADPFGWEKSYGADLSAVDPQKLVSSSDGMNSEAGGNASKLLGRMALLKVKEQEKMLQEIGDLYAAEIQRLNEMGENDLEITELPLKAKTINKGVWKEGSEPGGDNAFADNTYVEKVNMAVLKKPMKAEEVKKAQDGLTGGKSWDEYRKEKLTAAKEYFDKKIAEATQKYEERAVKAATKAKEKYIKDAKKGQKENGMSDEQIEKMAGYQYESIYSDERTKLDEVVKNLKSKYGVFERALETFNTEDAFVLPTDMNNPAELSGFGNSYGRLIDIKITDNFSPNASTISFATLDGRRKITFPINGKAGLGSDKADVIGIIDRLTRQASAMGDNHLRVLSMDASNWDKLTSNESRKDGYIITGNLLQALIDTKEQGLGGQLVKYTTDTGEVKTGILMPEKFEPNGLANEKPINSVAEKFELPSNKGGITEVTSSDGEVKIEQGFDYMKMARNYTIRVPKSNKKGGKYFLDKELLKMVDGGNFETRGNTMFAEVKAEKLKDVLDRLSELGVKVKEESGVHYRMEPSDASLSLSKPLEGRIAETVEKVSKQTGGKVKMVNSVEEIENPKVRKDIENGKQVTGWYDEKTGEVHLYMPNIHDTYTAEKTVWHETVGHKGMRGLLGDKFNDYMRGLWMDLDNPINAELRAYVKEKMNMNHLGFYDAIEEFIAKSAEDGKGEPGFWNYIKNKVTDALHEIGYRVSPNVKDVKYMLWLAKNVQKHGNDPWWKMRADAVKWKIEHEKTEYTKIEGGELYDNDGKSHDFESMSREEWLEATDGEIHYRTAPNAATALDRYHHALDRHSYMATEAFMDNMLSLKKLMEAIDPSIRKIEDVNSSMNPYLMQNITEGMMSDKSKLFEIRYMDPLSKAMSSVLDCFDGKKVEDRIRNFNLYMIRKHGLERNRVLFVRDKIREERKVKSEESDSIDALETAWKDERSDLRQKLDSGQIDLREYYRQMDEWIVQNLDKDFKAEEHDYSGMHGLQGIDDMKSPYDDAGAIDEVMSQEASMESMKKGSVADFWKKVKAATDYSVNSDYESGLISQITHDGVLDMFDWYVPLRKFDEATAEDVYGYVTEMGDPSNYIGTTLMNAKGRKSLSNVEILAQIGLMGNRAIRNGGQNMVKQAFARFVRNSGEQNLVKETKVWVEKTGTDLNGNDIWEEAYPQIPEGASADDVASIVDAFETDMRTKQAKGEAKSLSNGTDIGFKFQRAKDKSQHFVDVKIAGRTHRFVVLGNPRAAQALNGMLENGKASVRSLQTVTRWMAMASTSWNPEFVMRNIVRDMEFASSHVAAKEGGRYLAKWSRYYGELNPLNMFYNEGAGSLKSMKWKDFKNGVGYGLYARYREGTLGNSKMERYFKEFMENGGETGFVQLFSMHDMEKSYKSIVEKESAKGANKVMVNAVEVLKKLGKNVESLNEVAENMARFATYCTSRDLGRSAARSAYDAKEVSTNFNRHGSGDAIKSFKNGEMGDWQKARRNTYGFVAGYLRNYSMFFNAGIQSTNLLFKNIKRAPVGTTVAMTSAPFALALIMAAVNNAIIQNEDDKDRGNVKDPYGELPDYIRRNNLCIYVGKNRFVTVPLAIELRAFYSLGDLAAGQTFAKNVKSQRNMAMDAVGCMSQLFPVMDFLNNPNYEKSLGNGVGMTTEGIAPTAIVPFIEWWLNNDWKGAPIRRTGDKTDLNPAWQNAYNNVPARLVDLNKWVNAKTNNIAPGNPEMKGNDALDWITDPSMLNHFYSSWSGGMGTFVQRTAGLGAKATTGKADEIEVGDVPFLRSFFYTPREQSSMARTKAKWYNYKEEMEQTIANNDKLKSKNVPTMKRIENAAALEKFEGSAEQRKVNIIKNAEKRMRHWNTMRKKWADDKKQVDFANKNIEMIMQEAVEDLDRIE